MRILVVEDDAELRQTLKRTLERESFVVDTAPNGREGSYMARTNEYDLMLLDNILPYKSGFQVCSDIRQSGITTPILLLSIKSETEEKIHLLDGGADDYITKPYSHKELMARIRALTRRGSTLYKNKLFAGNLVLDSMKGEVRRDGTLIYLTRKEFSLLELLLRHKGSVVSRGTILEHVWDINGSMLSKTIEMHIGNLRKKVESGKEKLIVTVPGRGYKILG